MLNRNFKGNIRYRVFIRILTNTEKLRMKYLYKILLTKPKVNNESG